MFKGLSPTDIAKVSQLIGGAAALLAGGDGRDVNQGAATSQSAALNNYLTHAQIAELNQKLKLCRGNNGCEVELFAAYNNMSIANSEAMQSCGMDNVCVTYHLRLIGEASQSANELFSNASYNPWFRESLKIYQTADMNRGIATYRYNLHMESVCPGLQSGCVAAYKVKQGALTLADFTPVVGDGKAFIDAYQSGSGWEWASAVIGIAPVVGDGLGKLLKAGRLEGLARAEFDKLPEVALLTGPQRDAAYIEFVLKGSADANLTKPWKVEYVNGVPVWKGSGPLPGIIGVNAASQSTKALDNFGGAGNFVFDPKSGTFMISAGDTKGMHSVMAESIGYAGDSTVVLGGGFRKVAGSNVIETTEMSGHLGRNWNNSPQVRAQFESQMRQLGYEVRHTPY